MKVCSSVKYGLFSVLILGLVACKEQVAQIGQPAPEIAAYDLQGNPAKLTDWQGTRLLTFWSGNCGMCVKELKDLEMLVASHPNKVQIIGINVDGENADTQALVTKRQLHLPIIKDQMKISAERYQLIGTPTSFLIAPNGEILAKYEGLIPAADLKKLFNAS